MINKKLMMFGIFLLVGILLIVNVGVVEGYEYSNPKYTQSGFGYSLGFTTGDYTFDNEMCEAGQDFILQISPIGCEPSVVRSDLLEEQNVNVFCPILATKINPLIDIEAIDYLTFSDAELSKEVADLGFHPARSALGIKNDLNSPILNNIGYAVIELKQTSREEDMPDFVEGNLTAKIRYDIENAFGVGETSFYLKPLEKESEWNKEFFRYGFWETKGFLRAESVDTGEAVISVYSGNTLVRSEASYQEKVATFSLKEGETSNKIFLPTFDYCLGGLKVKLDDVVNPDTTARLRINGNEIEVVEKEKFLNNRCVVKNIERFGINQEVEISCKEDFNSGFFGSSNDFVLRITPKINITVDPGTGKETYEIGDRMFDYWKGQDKKTVYLAYAHVEDDITIEENLRAGLVALPDQPDSKTRLTDEEIKNKGGVFENARGGNILQKIGWGAGLSTNYLIEGESYYFLNYKEEQEIPGPSFFYLIEGRKVKLEGFASPIDLDYVKNNEDYQNAFEDFDTLISDFSSLKIKNLTETYGERALREKISLASSTRQKKTMVDLCDLFKEVHPDVGLPSECTNNLDLSSSEISRKSVLVDGDLSEILFKGIYEPTRKEYSAEVKIDYPDGFSQTVTLLKNQPFSLGRRVVGDLPTVGIPTVGIPGQMISGTESEKGKTIATRLINEEGFIAASASGVVGNLMAESGLIPSRIQGSGVRTGVLKIDGTTGYGYAQWTSRSRQQGLADHAEARGHNWKEVPLTDEINYGYLVEEMKQSKFWTGGYSLNHMKRITDPSEAATYFMKGFERPGTPHEEKRKRYAREIFSSLSEGSSSSSAGFSWPSESKVVTSCHGCRNLDGSSNSRSDKIDRDRGCNAVDENFHDGIDMGGGENKVTAAGDGVVFFTCQESNNRYPNGGGDCKGYGTHIVLKHNNGYYTVYSHLQPNLMVRVGDQVSAEQQIGVSGNTGFSQASHLHFGIYENVGVNGYTGRINDEGINPLCFFSSEGVTFRAASCEETYSDNAKDCSGIPDYSLTPSSPEITLTDDFIKLTDLGEGYAEIYGEIISRNLFQKGFTSKTFILNEDDPAKEGYYFFTLKKVNLEQVAKVSIIPSINYAETEVEFPFRIEIEKRLFKLSPEKTKEKIDKLNKTIEKWEEVSTTLGKTVKTIKQACVVTSGGLTLWNLAKNSQGKGIARREVMKGENGWYEKCSNWVNSKTPGTAGKIYETQEECLIKESDKIDRDVQEMTGIIQDRQKEMKEIQSMEGLLLKKKFLGENIYDSEGIKKELSGKTSKILSRDIIKEINENKKPGEEIDYTTISDALGASEGYTLKELGEINLYTRILADESSTSTMKEMAKGRLYKSLFKVQVEVKRPLAKLSLSEESGLNNVGFIAKEDKEIKDFPVSFYEKFVDSKYHGRDVEGEKIKNHDFVVINHDPDNNQRYLIVHGEDGVVERTYWIGESRLTAENEPNPFGIRIKKFDKTSYENEFLYSSGSDSSEVEVSFYETEPYVGLPAIVPFDKAHGWYAASRHILPIGGNVKSYDKSGVVRSFYVGNVGQNGIEEFYSETGDDIYQLINLGTGSTYSSFYGLSKSETYKIVSSAQEAIEQASGQRAQKPNRKAVQIVTEVGGTWNIKVGSPAVDLPLTKCQDFMSPKECTVLFNVCDPVICPSSRCDYGGKYPVKDVIQSGFVGSSLLCLPNVKENIVVPVCLTGIQAASDSLLSIFKSYESCLQESLDSGKTVGICDEINSVYICEFAWRQAAPLAKIPLSKAVAKLSGKDSRGGGEYMNFADALEGAGASFDFLTQSYGQNSYAAFKARSFEQAGTPICKNFISGTVPRIDAMFDRLTEPDSPSQFHGRFDEIPFTSVTVPPTSHYKVFYHIYSGNDRGAYYKVYLRQGPETSFYQDAAFIRNVDSGYVAAGETATQTVDFTAPTGYKEMCINVNGQEECGFKEVSTSFALDYIQGKYAQQQIEQENIASERECISGSASFYNLLTPNVQSAAEGAINPAIYGRGIVRVCATDNPGKGTDLQRWTEVGTCGGEKTKCWLDKKSVEKAIKFSSTQNETLDKLQKRFEEASKKDENYVKDFDKAFSEIKDEENLRIRIRRINELMDRVFYNSQKAKLFLLRGQTYAELAIQAYTEFIHRGLTGGLCENDADCRGGRMCVEGRCSAPVLEVVGESLDTEVEDYTPEIVEEEIIPPSPPELIGKDDYISPKFELEISTFRGNNLCYKYFNDHWHWTNECSKAEEKYVPQEDELEPSFWSIYSSSNIDSKDEEFIESLNGKSYAGGLDLLVERTFKDSGGLFSGETFLISGDDDVKLSSKGVFQIPISQFYGDFELGEEERIFYFQHKNKEWNWWDSESSGETPPELILNIVNELFHDSRDLNGNFLSGAILIFEKASKKYPLLGLNPSGSSKDSYTTMSVNPANVNEIDWDLENSILILDRTLEVSSLKNGGKYSDNKYFVNQLYKHQLLTFEELNNIASNDKDMKEVMEILKGSDFEQPEIDPFYLLGKFIPSEESGFVLVGNAYTTKTNSYLRKETYEKFKEMHDAAEKEGVDLKIISATRSFTDQKRIWEDKWAASTISDNTERALDIMKFSAMPGTSRHHWGTEIDLNSLNNNYFESSQGKVEYNWLVNNAPGFGFCKVYTSREQRDLGYEEEKWHWSYMPLSQDILEQYGSQINYDLIGSFDGDSTAKEVDAISNYVYGITEGCSIS